MNIKSKITPTEKLVYRIQKMRNPHSILEWKSKGQDIIDMFIDSEPDSEQETELLEHGQEIIKICNSKLEKIKSNV